MLLWILSL